MSFNLENKITYRELAPSLQVLIDAVYGNSNDINTIKNNLGSPVGAVCFFLTKNIPAGWLDLTSGAVARREVFPDLWEYIQANCNIVSDTKWLELSKIQTSVPYFSTGDGSTTFRLPKIVDYIRCGTVSDTGKYYGDAIRNIQGSISSSGSYGPFWSGSNETMNGTGCITADKKATGDIEGFAAGSGWSGGLTIDASKTVPTADENRPKTVVMVLCIKAFSSAINPGTADVSKLANNVNDLNAKINEMTSKKPVAIRTGTITNGQVIPLPDGYTQEQCYWIVTPYHMQDYSTGNDILWFNCHANTNRVVTVTVEGQTSPQYVIAQYMIIGIG